MTVELQVNSLEHREHRQFVPPVCSMNDGLLN